MDINETINLNAQIMEKDTNGNSVQAAYLSASINSQTNSVNFTINITNKDITNANIADVQTQYTGFETTVKARAKELGINIFA